MGRSIGEVLKRYELMQRILFISMLILGVVILVSGLLFHFFSRFYTIVDWTSLLGTGLAIFGGVGTVLTTPERLDKLGKVSHDLGIVHAEYREREKRPAKNYIKTPTQGIFVVVLFLSSTLLMLLGILNLLHWIGQNS